MKGGVYHQPNTVQMGKREAYLTIRNYKDESVTISGGVPLDLLWQNEGEKLTGIFPGSCSEAYYRDYRLCPAGSPNTEGGVNRNIAREPFHKVTDLLVETETCTKEAKGFKQSCPDENRNGFFLSDELSSDWSHINQTEILVYHSWIGEYAKIADITLENGMKKAD